MFSYFLNNFNFTSRVKYQIHFKKPENVGYFGLIIGLKKITDKMVLRDIK